MGSVGSGLQQQLLPSAPLVGETMGDNTSSLGEALDPTSFSQQQLCTRRSGQVVMTEEQLEALRRQISVYATICQQLVEMHKASLSKELSAPGIMATGVQPSSVMDQVTMSPMHRATVRQRWTPSQNQLQILERLFEQGNGTPSKQRIKEITTELMQHGHVGETNVYNWFQNRKARAKRKQQLLPKDDGSEVDTDAESSQVKQFRSEPDPRHGGDSGGIVDHPDVGRSSDGRAQTGLDPWNGNVYQPGAATAVLLEQPEADIQRDLGAFTRTPSFQLDNLQGFKEECNRWQHCPPTMC
ncbi:hypothetical protein BDL97_06G119800 [Sphagnum fallax]|nr:hypothetical protein BDL97_06G119800 [Sphagnum fallax]